MIAVAGVQDVNNSKRSSRVESYADIFPIRTTEHTVVDRVLESPSRRFVDHMAEGGVAVGRAGVVPSRVNSTRMARPDRRR